LFAEGAAPAAAEKTVEVAPHERKAKGHGRAHFAAHLPRNVIECIVPESERACACCKKPLRRIGEDVCERGHLIPARIVVNRYVCEKLGCPGGHGVVTAKPPAGVIEGAKYEASVYAYLATAKFCDHQPLN